MACNTSLSSILKGCDNNVGGLKHVYLMPAEFITGTSINNGTITGMTYTSGATWVEIEFNKNTTFYTEEAAISLENGSTFYNQTLTIVIPRRQVASRNALSLLTAGQRNLKAVVQDQNGLYWQLGTANYLNVTALAEGSGTAKGDGSKYSLSLLAEEPLLAYEVSANLIVAPAFPV